MVVFKKGKNQRVIRNRIINDHLCKLNKYYSLAQKERDKIWHRRRHEINNQIIKLASTLIDYHIDRDDIYIRNNESFGDNDGERILDDEESFEYNELLEKHKDSLTKMTRDFRDISSVFEKIIRAYSISDHILFMIKLNKNLVDKPSRNKPALLLDKFRKKFN